MTELISFVQVYDELRITIIKSKSSVTTTLVILCPTQP